MTASSDAAELALYGCDLPRAEQERAFRQGEVPVAVYGLGKMGLPLAAVYAETSGNVTGADVDPAVVERINDGDCPVAGEPGLSDLVSTVVASGALTATTDTRAAADAASLHVVIVPTTLAADETPALDSLRAAVRDVGAGLDPGDVVVVESTLPPKTCEDVVVPLLVAESGLDASAFGLAVCPERTSSGRALRDIRHSHPKVVGGVDEESTRVATLVYETITSNEVLPVDAATAEAVKVFEGVYRDANIALANDLARCADDLGVDVTEAIEVANTQPYCDIHVPGIGVGGHCIPYYPHFLRDAVTADLPMVSTAREVNDAMPGFAVAKLAEMFAAVGDHLEGATVLVLGLAYRAGVAETRKSPGVDVATLLDRRGATPLVVDPLVDRPDSLVERGIEMVALADLPDVAPDVDAAVLATAHDEFRSLDWSAFDPLFVVDGRQALDLDDTAHRVYTIGRGRGAVGR